MTVKLHAKIKKHLDAAMKNNVEAMKHLEALENYQEPVKKEKKRGRPSKKK